MDNYEDSLKEINSQDREEKSTKIVNEFKAFLKLNKSVYNSFEGVKTEIGTILNDDISLDEAEYYHKLFLNYFENLKQLKADLNLISEYTFVPEYQKLIDKQYTFIISDVTLSESETARKKMFQLLEENKNTINKPTIKEAVRIHYKIDDVIEQIANIIIAEDSEIEIKKIESHIVHFEINNFYYCHDNYWESNLNSWTNQYENQQTGFQSYDLKTIVKFRVDFRQITEYKNFENRFSIMGTNVLIKEISGSTQELNYNYDTQFVYPNLRKRALPIITKQVPSDFSWFNWTYNEFNFACSNEAQERLSRGIDILIEILESKKIF